MRTQMQAALLKLLTPICSSIHWESVRPSDGYGFRGVWGAWGGVPWVAFSREQAGATEGLALRRDRLC